jgi:hypothetical protein
MMGMASTLKRYLCVLIILSAAAISGHARGDASLSGVATVIDGDTLEIHGQLIRLHGIDAPESGQSCERAGQHYRCGQQAALALADRIGQRTVRCEPQGQDRYQRVIAICRLGEHELAFGEICTAFLEQQAQGLAGVFAAGEHAVGVLHRRHGDVAPFHAGIGAAFDEMEARNRGQAHQIVERENFWRADQARDRAVDHEAVAARIDVLPALVMAFEMQARRRDHPERALQRREGDARRVGLGQARRLTALEPALVTRRLSVRQRHDGPPQRRRPRQRFDDIGIASSLREGGGRGRRRAGGEERAAQKIAASFGHRCDLLGRKSRSGKSLSLWNRL